METHRTVIKIQKSSWQMDHKDRVLLLGSCFSESIGSKLRNSKFDVCVNPFGTLFSPHVILKLIQRALQGKSFERNEFFQHDGVWHNWELNNTCSSADLDSSLPVLNNRLDQLKNWLTHSDYICITLGTAWVYTLVEGGKLVANCHKVSGTKFEKSCLEYDSVCSILTEISKCLMSVNPKTKIIYTLSPVRHWKDGPVQNAKSKAILRLAIEDVLSEHTAYFPSYEIMMDDLRDYRYYESDMIHPNQLAIEYIYSRFSEMYFTEETQELNRKIGQIMSALNHRPRHSESLSQLSFQNDTDKKKAQLLTAFPFLKDRF